MPLKWSEFFYYDPSSYSCLRRKTDWVSGKNGCTVRARAGEASGSLSTTEVPYYDVYAEGRLIRAHIVVWLLHNDGVPDGFIVDHINGNSLDNRIENLRLTTPEGNSRNMGMKCSNSSGITGVHLKEDQRGTKTYSRWIAQWFGMDGKRRSKSFSVERFGFDSAFQMAVMARMSAIEELNKQGAGYTERHGKENKCF